MSLTWDFRAHRMSYCRRILEFPKNHAAGKTGAANTSNMKTATPKPRAGRQHCGQLPEAPKGGFAMTYKRAGSSRADPCDEQEGTPWRY